MLSKHSRILSDIQEDLLSLSKLLNDYEDTQILTFDQKWKATKIRAQLDVEIDTLFALLRG